MNEAVANIIDDACNKSNLYGQIKALMQLRKEINEKIIILEANLEKIEVSNGK